MGRVAPPVGLARVRGGEVGERVKTSHQPQCAGQPVHLLMRQPPAGEQGLRDRGHGGPLVRRGDDRTGALLRLHHEVPGVGF
jgi:hypothetical protein